MADLAQIIGIKISVSSDVLEQLNADADLTKLIDPETAQLIAEELGVKVELKIESVTDKLKDTNEAKDLKERPPIVTIMGHVDHGKTSLLDVIRNSNVADKESGNITQHLGAYYVETPNVAITFLETPGHEAFVAMRARGANITDIVILVVSADDGPKPQTVEAIKHAQIAKVPIIVAITKCDKPDINIQKVTESLMQYSLIAEEYGGYTTVIKVSSKSKEGIKELLESILILAKSLNFKASYVSKAKGVVIESRLDRNRGNLNSLLVQSGELKVGDYILCGAIHGKVRTITNDNSQEIKSALPSMPVEITGLNSMPPVGTSFQVAEEKIAKLAAEKHLIEQKELIAPPNLEELLQASNTAKGLFIILKADVNGSMEAVQKLIAEIKHEQIKPKVVLASLGIVSMSDVNLAITTGAILIGFNVQCDNEAKKTAEKEDINIYLHNVIYELIDNVRNLASGMLSPIIHESLQGKAKVLETFHITKIGQIAGCQVMDGKIVKDSILKVIRDDAVIHTSKLASLKQFQSDVGEVSVGNECGIAVQGYKNFKAGDLVECYLQTKEEVYLS